MLTRRVAAKLIRRTGFGATGSVIDRVVTLGAENYVTESLRSDPASDPGGIMTPPPPLPNPGTDAVLHSDQAAALMHWWVRRMVNVRQPFGEKMTWVWHKYFATSIYKVWFADPMLAQNDKFRRLGRRSFADLSRSILTDAATIWYLDGQANSSLAPNENLAREFLELFTIGHGNYTEDDVRDSARALTGWTVDRSTASSWFEPSTHDAGVKRVLGAVGALDAYSLVDHLTSLPVSHSHVVNRLWSYLVGPLGPDPVTASYLTRVFAADLDLSNLITAMLTCRAFEGAVGSMTADHVEWLIGAVRTLGFAVIDDVAAAEVLGWLWELGQVPFGPPSIGGWPSGTATLNSAASWARFNVASTLAARVDLSAISGTVASRLETVGYLLGVPSWSDSTADALRTVASDPERLLAFALISPDYLTD